ncbi:MAG: pyridoxamine 5'-phosphate oxidase family protein [Candidatus Zixiibacteriota bacterium]
MEKLDYSLDENKEFAIIAKKALVGYLGILTPDGYPRVVPMNFAADGTTIYIHGEKRGETFEALSRGQRVTFSIDLQFSFIPSYWTSQINACATTMLYKSALIKGTGRLIDDPQDSLKGLHLLMDKYQPEGGYVPMEPGERTYKGLYKSTAVYKIVPDIVTVKVNFRQKKSIEYNRMLVEKLEERAKGPDIETAREIRKMLGEQAKKDS